MKPVRRSWFLSPVYAAGVGFRNALYDSGIIATHRCRVPVISVGNITAGGTGKTPMIELLIRLLESRGKRVAVLSRGYGRKNSVPVVLGPAAERNDASVLALGDELTQIARKFPGVIIAADSDRVRSATRIEQEYPVDVFLLDDGFQHRRLARNLDIVLIDVTKPVAREPMLPAGYRREPMGALHRANLIGYTRVDLSWTEDAVYLAKDLHGMQIEFVPRGWIDGITGAKHPLDVLGNRPVFGFCGIGNPQSFFATLEKLHLNVTERMSAGDHYWYTDVLIDAMTRKMPYHAAYVTTEKDLVRLTVAQKEKLGNDNLFGLEIAASIVRGEDLLLTALSRLGF